MPELLVRAPSAERSLPTLLHLNGMLNNLKKRTDEFIEVGIKLFTLILRIPVSRFGYYTQVINHNTY